MYTVHSIAELRAQVLAWRRAGERVALVPTMGNLHRGHLYLVERARALVPRTIASIFVNPTQFGPNEDYAGYPRTLAEDQSQLEGAGLDLLFAPTVAAIYPRPLEAMTQVTVPVLSQILCGVRRPIHFGGVATVVAKLFNLVQPDVALFGEKDWQQLVIIRRMTADLDLPIEIVGVPTVREADGLAMSSRNSYLSAEERAVAPTLYATLTAFAEQVRTGRRDYVALETDAGARLVAAGFRPDYCEIRRADDCNHPLPRIGNCEFWQRSGWVGRG